MTEPTLKQFHSSAPDFGNSLAAYIHGFAERVKTSLSGSAILPKYMAALADFHNHVAGLGIYDPCVVTLYQLHQKRHEVGERGVFDRYEFVPTDLQNRLLATLGHASPAPPPDQTLNEFVMAGVIDTIEGYTVLSNAAGTASDAQGEAEAHLQAERDAHMAAAAELEQARGEIESLNEEIRELESQVQMLGAFLPQDRAPAKPRRTKVEGQTGIYLASNGEDYEIIYKEDGKNRYRIIGPDLDEAIAARAEATEAVAA